MARMREALETYAARLCARSPERGRFAELRADFEAQRAALEAPEPPGSDYSRYYALIARLDDAINQGARNPYLLAGLGGLRGHLERLRQIARRRPPWMLQSVNEHLAICSAIYDGDESLAAQSTAVHINNSLRNILAVMADDVGGPLAHGYPTATAAYDKDRLRSEASGDARHRSPLDPDLPSLQVKGEPGYPVPQVVTLGLPRPVVVSPEEVEPCVPGRRSCWLYWLAWRSGLRLPHLPGRVTASTDPVMLLRRNSSPERPLRSRALACWPPGSVTIVPAVR